MTWKRVGRVAAAVVGAAGMVVLLPSPAHAASRVFTSGPGCTTWSTVACWDGGTTTAVAGDDVTVSGLAGSTYDLGTVQLRSLTITGTNLGTTISGGPIHLQSGGSVGGTDVHLPTVALHGPATFTSTGDTLYVISITGTGPVTVGAGAGQVFVSNASSYTGATTVEGMMTAPVNGAVPTGSAVTVDTGGSLYFTSSSTIGSLAGAGDVFVQNGTLTVGGDGTSTTFSGRLRNNAGCNSCTSLAKTGAGTLTLSGTHQHTGTTTVQEGELVLSGTLPGAITVESGATLTVDGGVVDGMVTVEPGGTFVNAGGTFNGGLLAPPDAPSAVTATAGDGQATVAFTAPADNGSAITGYTVTADPGGATATGTESPITVPGLTNGTSYTFTVTATNGVDTGPASSPSAAVVPTVPFVPSPTPPAPVPPPSTPPRPGTVPAAGGTTPFFLTSDGRVLPVPLPPGLPGTPAAAIAISPTESIAVTPDGRVFTTSAGHHFGSVTTPLNAPVVGLGVHWVRSGDGWAPGGYWLVAGDGGVFAFGSAPFRGSLGDRRLNRPIIGISPTATGDGYLLTGGDGGVFTFGDGVFHGSMGGVRLNAPVVAITATPSGRGYWLTGADGGVFTFGDARFLGSGAARRQIFGGLVPAPDGTYWLITREGTTVRFG